MPDCVLPGLGPLGLHPVERVVTANVPVDVVQGQHPAKTLNSSKMLNLYSSVVLNSLLVLRVEERLRDELRVGPLRLGQNVRRVPRHRRRGLGRRNLNIGGGLLGLVKFVANLCR